MDLLQTFIFNDSKHNVRVVRNNDDEPMFCASDVGKVLQLKNIRASIEDFDEDERVVNSIYTPGGDQNVTFLTDQGVYKLIMRSRKPIAKPFQKWVFKVIKDIQKNGRYEMQKEIDELKCNNDDMKDSIKLVTKYKDTEDARVSKILVDGCREKTLVYYGKIKTMDDGRFLIKIGCTKNIKVRLHSLKQEFGNMNILKVFECDKQVEFESFLHDRDGIKEFRYKEIINGLKRSNEVFLFTEEQLKKAVIIAERNISKFIINNNKRDIDEIIEANPQNNKKFKIIFDALDALGLSNEEKDDPESPEYESNRGYTTINGNKVQKYNDKLELVETYSRIIEVMRVKQYSEFSRSGIQNAIIDKTIYKGFRWASLDRNLPDETIQDIGETCFKNIVKTGYAATLTKDGKSIVKVYANFKELGISEGYKGSDAVLKRMKKGKSLDDGRILKRYSDVESEIKDEWLKNNELPIIKNNHVSIGINKLDPHTNEVLKTYSSQVEVVTKYGMAPRTLRSAIKGNIVQRRFKWSYAS